MNKNSIVLLSLTLLAISVSVAYFYSMNRPDTQSSVPAGKEITASQVPDLLANGALFVDVREPDEIAQQKYNLEPVLTIPLGQLEKRMSELPKDATIIVACRSGNRSLQAVELLRENGYSSALSLSGGIIAWYNK
jgi:rhodanese-related sulfurtransferase